MQFAGLLLLLADRRLTPHHALQDAPRAVWLTPAIHQLGAYGSGGGLGGSRSRLVVIATHAMQSTRSGRARTALCRSIPHDADRSVLWNARSFRVST